MSNPSVPKDGHVRQPSRMPNAHASSMSTKINPTLNKNGNIDRTSPDDSTSAQTVLQTTSGPPFPPQSGSPGVWTPSTSTNDADGPTNYSTAPLLPQSTIGNAGPGSRHPPSTPSAHLAVAPIVRSTLHSPAMARALSSGNLDIPHCASRLRQQLQYLKNMSVRKLRGEVSTLRRSLMDLLNLQGRIPSSARLHRFIEADRTTSTSETINVELFSMFSTTVSNETTARRNSTSLLGEALLDFRLNCDSDRVEPLCERHATARKNRSVQRNPQPSSLPKPPSSSNAEPRTVQASSDRTAEHPEHQGPNNNPLPSNRIDDTPERTREVDDDPDEVLDGDMNAEWVLAPGEVRSKMV